MAAYAATVTALMKRAVKVDQVTGIGMFMGRCDVTNYNTTLAEITAITGKFGTLMEVICSSISDNGYLMRWDKTGKALKAFYPTDAHQHSFAVQSAGVIGASMEVGLSADADTATFEGGTGITAVRTLAPATSPVVAAVKAAATEVVTDVDVGVVEFVAYGLI